MVSEGKYKAMNSFLTSIAEIFNWQEAHLQEVPDKLAQNILTAASK